MDLATALQPAMVVLEDVDLVAMERVFEPTNAILFELLNAMDGLDEDHDVLFVPDDEPPGPARAGLAVAPGPDRPGRRTAATGREGRRRLLELYGQGLDLRLQDEDDAIAALEGTSPAFIRELLRRAALLAAEQSDGPLEVTDGHLRAALAELRQGRR